MDNIKLYLKLGRECGTNLTHHGLQWRAVVNIVMNQNSRKIRDDAQVACDVGLLDDRTVCSFLVLDS